VKTTHACMGTSEMKAFTSCPPLARLASSPSRRRVRDEKPWWPWRHCGCWPRSGMCLRQGIQEEMLMLKM
jgi:hypothetical protein